MSPSSRRSPSGPGCRHHRHVGWRRALCAVRSPAPKSVSRPTPARPRPPALLDARPVTGVRGDVVARPRWRKRRRTESGVRRTAMGLTRRQRRELAALGEQLGREDPDLAAQLSRPAGSSVSPSTRPHPYRCSGRSGPVGPGTDAGRLRPGADGSYGDHGRCHHVDDLLDSLAARPGADSALTTSRVSSSTAQPARSPRSAVSHVLTRTRRSLAAACFRRRP